MYNNNENPMVEQLKELTNEVGNLQVTIEEMNSHLKCDFTGWSLAEAVSQLAYQLERYNNLLEKK
jgi:hypothetical protein